MYEVCMRSAEVVNKRYPVPSIRPLKQHVSCSMPYKKYAQYGTTVGSVVCTPM